MKNSLTRLIAGLAVLALLAGFAVGPARSAFADVPSGPASCMGIEASAVSPPGSSNENPIAQLGMPAVAPALRSLGLTTAFAQNHLGSHEACDGLLP